MSTETLHTVRDFIRYAITRFEQGNVFYGHGTDNASDEAVALIGGWLRLPMESFGQFLDCQLTTEEKKTLSSLIDQRVIQRVPVPYLTQRAWFSGLEFEIDETALIPRSPIAELIGNQFSPWVDPDQVTSILDLCTGGGCIAIACNYAFPDATVEASDLSEKALTLAKKNCSRHQANIKLTQSDLFTEVSKGPFDIIVSNPPYVGDAEISTLPEEYHHEPRMALFSEHNGLQIPVKIMADAANYLNPEGILVLEVGNSKEILEQAFPDIPFLWIDFEHGGDGVLLMTQEELTSFQPLFDQYNSSHN